MKRSQIDLISKIMTHTKKNRDQFKIQSIFRRCEIAKATTSSMIDL